MNQEEIYEKNANSIMEAFHYIYANPEDYEYHLRKCCINVYVATFLVDVADSFIADTDKEMEKIQMATKGYTHKRINNIRNHIKSISDITNIICKVDFSGSLESISRSEDQSTEIYELIKAYMDHTNDGEGFRAILNGIKRRKLHNHIFERENEDSKVQRDNS